MARLDSEGDVLLAGPAVRAVAAGANRVTVLCGPRGRQAAGLLPGVDDVLVHLASWIDPAPPPLDRRATLAFVDEIRRRQIDQALIFTSFHQSPLPLALLLRLAGVPTIAAICEDYPGSLLDVRHHVDEDVHEVERALSLAATLDHRLPAGDDGRLDVEAEPPPAGLPSRYVVVHPGAAAPARAWSPARHTRLVRALGRAGENVVVTGGPDEAELTATVSRGAAAAVDLGGRTSLASLAGVIAGAEAIVVGNTGPAHLAASVGTPIVSLFAPTVPATRWRPWGVELELLHVDVECAGCRARSCPVPGHPCLEGVGVGDAMNALNRVRRAARAGTEALVA
jgi:ADP-heptose:LPS heptosyltransferase